MEAWPTIAVSNVLSVILHVECSARRAAPPGGWKGKLQLAMIATLKKWHNNSVNNIGISTGLFFRTSNWNSAKNSVPTRLGKGRGAKEIGHNLVRKRHKIGHTFTRERPKFCIVGDWWKHGHKICKHFTNIFTSAVWKPQKSNYIL